jgi:hypothetical protein
VDPHGRLLETCAEISRWEASPTGWSGGRSGWHQALPPDAADLNILALKLKGLGRSPRDGGEARLPAEVAYDRSPGQPPDPHLGIRSDLELDLVTGAPAPLGGILLSAAERELDCAESLQHAGVASVSPVALFEFPALSFSTPSGRQTLGVSVTGSPVASALRCSVLLPQGHLPAEEALPEIRRIARALGIGTADVVDTRLRLGLVAACYRRFGTTLRGFAQAGWYRYSGHADNFVIDDTGAAVLVDLDSCQRTAELLPESAAMEEVRDGMSGLYNLACAFFAPAALDEMADEELVSEEPFSAFLDGWDPESAGTNGAIGRVIAEYVVASRTRLRHYEPFLRAETEAGDHLYRHVRHDRDLTFILLYRIAFERRWARPGPHRLPFGVDALDERLLRFAGRPRFELLQDLLG